MIRQLQRYTMIAAGTLVVALGFNWFLSPNHIASGGLSGASILLGGIFRIDPMIILWIGSLLILLVSAFALGIRSLAASVVGSVLMPFFVLLTHSWQQLTDNPLLASIYGGVMTGIGLGIVFRARGNTGGFTLIAQLLHKWLAIKPSQAIMAMDSVVVIAAGALLAPEKALYALISVFVTRKSMEMVLKLQRCSKVAYIITSSEHEHALSKAVLQDLDRGMTKLSGTGGYTDDHRVIMMVVLASEKAHKLKLLVQALDPHAFIVFTDADDVAGEGFNHEPGTTPASLNRTPKASVRL
ncbi:YitT family protein [Paenibacillus sp. UNC451MF]|uniref:YitT family protein n=1 Tax=Paenibacillus sp. UNC451MF TaxID=1449063 RepID=UPI00068A0752|nr:YitT family protein [Paenibacillus sp. UNC451MF]